MNDPAQEGGCSCGAVRYRLGAEPIFVNNCYCTLCQQQTGSTSVVNAFFETEQVQTLQGELTSHVLTGGSGKPHQILRCASCGTALFSHYSGLGELGIAVRVGTLDAPSAFRPDAAIHVASKMPWVTLPEGIPAFEGRYNPPDLLPPERYARLEALMARRKAQLAGPNEGTNG